MNFRDRKGLFYSQSDPGCRDCEEPDEPAEEDPGGPLPPPTPPSPEPAPPVEAGGGGHNPCNDTTDVTFVKAYLSDAQTLAAKLDVPAEWVLAVGSIESTYGTSDIAKRENNFFGIHWGSVAAANGATQSTTNPIVANWDWGTDGFMGSGNAMVALALSDGAAHVKTALEFFTDIHKQFGVPSDSYAADMVKVVDSVAARLKCP